MHMAEAFIQSHLHCMVYILLVKAFPGNQTHYLCVASIQCYVMPSITGQPDCSSIWHHLWHRNYTLHLILGHKCGRSFRLAELKYSKASLNKLTSLFSLPCFLFSVWDAVFCVLHGRPQWMGSGRSGVHGAIAQWPVPTGRSRGRGSAQRLLMGDLSAEDIGRRAENAPILSVQVRLRFLLNLIHLKGNLCVYLYFSIQSKVF